MKYELTLTGGRDSKGGTNRTSITDEMTGFDQIIRKLEGALPVMEEGMAPGEWREVDVRIRVTAPPLEVVK